MNKAGSGSVSQLYGSADPDPYQNVTDLQHCNLRIVNCIDTPKFLTVISLTPRPCT